MNYHLVMSYLSPAAQENQRCEVRVRSHVGGNSSAPAFVAPPGSGIRGDSRPHFHAQPRIAHQGGSREWTTVVLRLWSPGSQPPASGKASRHATRGLKAAVRGPSPLEDGP
jgi:hypothetical protein